MHRVKPPLQKHAIKKRRINLTLRNLVNPKSNPLGFAMALANHFRYYGAPLKLTVPKDVPIEMHKELFDRYEAVANQCGSELKIEIDDLSRKERSGKHRELRTRLKKEYAARGLDEEVMQKIVGKTNVVLETTKRALDWIETNKF